MDRSESIQHLAAALVAAQGELTNPPKDASANLGGNGPKYQFTNLATLCAHVRPVLAKHELEYVQPPISGERVAGCETILMHSSGEYISEVYTMPVPGKVVKGNEREPGPHEYGSVLTYCRRYSLQALLGIVGEDDDDGNIAQSTHNEKYEELVKQNEVKEKQIKTRDKIIELTATYQDQLQAMHEGCALDDADAVVAAKMTIDDDDFALLNMKDENGPISKELKAFLKGSAVADIEEQIAEAAAAAS